ncbi:DNA-binding domain-containing protein [uncultured Roseovarius sp.]|uniref:HvfC/BufC N-terminal domain-containing protein n=1 Tax=uncultured Roseovarius sp. TaxID=293344 RepID=UPI00263753DB|nr:DNA-binding domain-containing protein [uncultured Roseovarius sp.]
MSVSQTAFHTALLDASEAVPEGLSDGVGHPAGSRFSVYRNNVAVSLTEALELSFPAIVKLLGEENFKGLAGIFLRQNPPETPIMMQYGAAFPDFLAGFEPLAHIGYLPDVARLEQAVRVSYHAADATPVDPEVLQELSPEELATARLELAPSLQVIRSPWPIHQIWAYNLEEGSPKPTGGAQSVLILRPEFDPELTPISSGIAAFIIALLRGETLPEANEAAIESEEDFDLSHGLGLLLSAQAITRIKTGEDQ